MPRQTPAVHPALRVGMAETRPFRSAVIGAVLIAYHNVVAVAFAHDTSRRKFAYDLWGATR